MSGKCFRGTLPTGTCGQAAFHVNRSALVPCGEVGPHAQMHKRKTHMSDRDAQIQELAKKKLVYHIPDMDAVTVRRDETYRTSGDDALLMDLYYPAETKSGVRLAVVVIVMGYPDPQG